MKLAIADPPYLGKSYFYDGVGPRANSGSLNPSYAADSHPDAARWDDPATHQALVADLVDTYDGWVIALLPAHLRTYLQWTPPETRVAVWHDPHAMPTGAHPRRRWEAVLVRVPPGRRQVVKVSTPVADVLTTPHQDTRPGPKSFAGRKPRAWSRWVLDMMGYYQDVDTVADLFGGSGAVTGEVAQLVLPLAMP